jgi:hypothetical protein
VSRKPLEEPVAWYGPIVMNRLRHPQALLEGRQKEIFADRDRKLEAASERRKQKRQAARQAALDGQPASPTM